MPRKPDAMSVFDGVFSGWQSSDPWEHAAGQAPRYGPDFGLLVALLTVATGGGSTSESGVFPRGIDLWLSSELRRAGFQDEEVWPRLSRPRILPRDVALLLKALPASLRQEVGRRVAETPAVSPTDATVLGRAYDKQVDVCIARWDRGPEVLVSTKAQLSSFAKNLPNRFEEAYGDAANLRARYPLAATGFFFVQRATILATEPDAFERAKDMMRKLRAEGDGPGYTATGLALVDWDDTDPDRRVHVVLDPIPDDLHPAQFMERTIQQVLRVTPVTHHVTARERLERRHLPVAEVDADETGSDTSPVDPPREGTGTS